ncbi:uncharacterized protein LOC135700925 [Ochlerotatus camptorhynchus]|uniref:uncharacterized protein LOC135700925 n=1 Tax=Ochlerotatus camptorhynchus TaxID=644619 RepID=UPI0031D5E3AA
MGNEVGKEAEVKSSYDKVLQQAQDMERLVTQILERNDSSRIVDVEKQFDKHSVTEKPNNNSGSGCCRKHDSPKPNESSQLMPSKTQLATKNAAKTKLPTFSGNPEEWHYFRASYETSTAACGFNDSENLVRLRDSLQGPALESVRGLLILPKLVPKAIDALHRLYGNPETLLEWHLEKVRKLENPNPKKMNTCVSFANALEQLCNLMEAAELEYRLIDSALFEELVYKLPNMQILEWIDHAKLKKSVTLRTFSDFASMKVAKMRETNPTGYRAVLKEALPDQGPKTDQSNSVKTGAVKREKSTLATTAAAGEKGKKEYNKRCRLCKRFGHPLWYCREFSTMKVEARTVLVESWNVCKICLGDHLIEGKSRCPHRIRCNVGKCRESHNALLHPDASDEVNDKYLDVI